MEDQPYFLSKKINCNKKVERGKQLINLQKCFSLLNRLYSEILNDIIMDIQPSMIYNLAAAYNFKLGLCAFKNQNNQVAIDHFRRAIEFDPECYYPYVALAEILLKEPTPMENPRNVDEAIELLMKSKQINDKDQKIYSLLGLAYTYKNELSSAIQFHKAAVRINPRMYQEYYKLGSAYEMSKQKREALRTYILLNNINPNLEKVWTKLVRLLWECQRKQEAIYYQQRFVLRLRNQQNQNHQFLGRMLGQVYRFSEAINSLQRAIYWNNKKKESPCVSAYILLADFYQERGFLKRSIKWYQNALKVLKEDFILFTKLAHAYAKDSRKNKAKIFYYRALQMNPTAQANVNYGLLLEDLNQNDQAIWHYKQAKRSDPNYIKGYECLGNVYQKQGQVLKAVENYQIAISLDQVSSQSLRRLYEIMLAQKKYDAAVKYSLCAIPITLKYVKQLWCAYFMVKKKRVNQQMQELHSRIQGLMIEMQGFYNMGECLYEMGLMDEALQILSRAMFYEKFVRRVLQQMKMPLEKLIDGIALGNIKYFWTAPKMPVRR